MKKSLTVLCLFFMLLCGCSVNASETEGKTKQQGKNKKYEICGEKVKIREIYFDDEEDFRCSADNPCWEEIHGTGRVSTCTCMNKQSIV